MASSESDYAVLLGNRSAKFNWTYPLKNWSNLICNFFDFYRKKQELELLKPKLSSMRVTVSSHMIFPRGHNKTSLKRRSTKTTRPMYNSTREVFHITCLLDMVMILRLLKRGTLPQPIRYLLKKNSKLIRSYHKLASNRRTLLYKKWISTPWQLMFQLSLEVSSKRNR